VTIGERGVLLVTGTSTGIGQATAVRAAAAGWRVVATMRDPARDGALREAAAEHGVELDVLPLDVTDQDSVAACFEDVRRTHGRLDAVVNNAGISNFDPTVEMSTLAALRTALEVNFVGMVAVTRLAMPLLRASRGRLVSIGSVHGVVGQPFNEAYAAAKFAGEGFLESLAPVAAVHGVAVSVVVPGFVSDTEFGRFPDINRRTIEADSGPYAGTFADYFRWVVEDGWEGAAQSRWEVADVVVRTLADPRPPFRVPTSPWVRAYLADKLADIDGTAVQALARTWVGAADAVPAR
jgi:NAD(P)-dependent dehydrogenase (short-subunit alcohol dehydrogenase family)